MKLGQPLGAPRSVAFESIALGAFFLLTLTAVRWIDVGVAIAATAMLAATPLQSAWGALLARRATWLAIGVGGLLFFIAIAGGSGGQTVSSTATLVAPLVLVCGYLILRGRLDRPWLRWACTSVLATVVVVVGVVWISIVDRPEIDVLEFHVAAADSLANGSNPYVDARVMDTSPSAEPGTEIVGYPYPPLTMAVYAVATWVLGDPRWAGMLAVVSAVVLITRPWASLGRQQAAAALAICLAFVLQPALGHVLRQGWTEPIALPLLAGVGLLWRKHPVAAAVLLGLTFGLKQYWIVALPLLIFWNDTFRWRRVALVGGVAALSLAPAFMAEPGAAWRAMVVNILQIAPRADSIGLSGVGWDTPFWLVLAVSAAVALWMARGGESASRFLVALGAVLATSYLFGAQAFINYWFLIGSMAVIAVALSVNEQQLQPIEDPVGAIG